MRGSGCLGANGLCCFESTVCLHQGHWSDPVIDTGFDAKSSLFSGRFISMETESGRYACTSAALPLTVAAAEAGLGVGTV